jgi:aminopeptidase N
MQSSALQSIFTFCQRPALRVSLLLALCSGSVSLAADKHPAGDDEHSLAEKLPAFDEASGRKVASWGKSRSFDFSAARIELDIPSMATPLLKGRVTHTATVISQTQYEMVLDCNGPQVSAVRVNGAPAQFAMRRAQSWLGTFPALRDEEGEPQRQELVIALPTALARGAAATVEIDYSLDFASNKGVGLTWHQAEGGKPFVHAQGQAELSSIWFPCFDSPAEFITSEVIVTVEDGYTVVANGTLQSAAPTSDGRTRWAWSMPREHAVYLTTLAIGDFEEVQVGGDATARPGLSMPVWVPRGEAAKAQVLFAQTAPIIAFFEETFDEPFAWPQYGQAVVPGFAWGGMENVGMTLYTPGMLSYVDQENGQYKADGLIAHETAHQWWGNLVTCKTWADLWVNEGWATYCEALWFEHAARPEGAEAQRRAYLKEVRGWLASNIKDNHAVAPTDVAMVNNRFRDPDSQFVKADNPYPKGALVLHALREKLGDRVFFASARAFLDRHKGTPVETADLRKQFERTSGQSLERFFEQWTMRPGIARVQASVSWDAPASKVSVALTQSQQIDRWNPAYAIDLPVQFIFADGTMQTANASFDTRSASFEFPLGMMPAAVIIDPNFSQLAEVQGRVTVLDTNFSQQFATPEAEAQPPAQPAATTSNADSK